MMAVMPYSANGKPRWGGEKVPAKVACAIGCSPPPPAPCNTRKRRRSPRLGDNPQSRELTVNTPKQAMKKRFRPKAPASQPLIGRMMAFETRYEVRTHVLWSLLAPRFPAMYGRATLAMLVSRTSMKAASATTTAISQGLYLGRQTSWSRVIAAVLIGGKHRAQRSCRAEADDRDSLQDRERSSQESAEQFSRNCQWRFPVGAD